jgi:hypothetical protein
MVDTSFQQRLHFHRVVLVVLLLQVVVFASSDARLHDNAQNRHDRNARDEHEGQPVRGRGVEGEFFRTEQVRNNLRKVTFGHPERGHGEGDQVRTIYGSGHDEQRLLEDEREHTEEQRGPDEYEPVRPRERDERGAEWRGENDARENTSEHGAECEQTQVEDAHEHEAQNDA